MINQKHPRRLVLAFALFGACSSAAQSPTDDNSTGGHATTPARSGGSSGSAASGGSSSSGGGSGGSSVPGNSGGTTGSGGGSSGTSGSGGTTDSDAATTDAPDSSGGDDSGTPPAGGPALETISVPASGDAVATKAMLDKDQLYLLRASGAIDFGGTKVDAEFAGTADSAGGIDVGIDDGMKELIEPTAGGAGVKPGPNRMKWFGAYRADHVYYMIVIGAGAPLSLKLVRPANAALGTGSIDVGVYRLTPMAGGIGTALETVKVALIPKTAMEASMLTPAAGSVYLLRVAGEAQVGGPGANGDAEYDDYKGATGSNEGEGGADFGVCVDEPCSAKRVRKWGPYRQDHNYYMLYAGTGMPIKFAYCDTGFGDNAGNLPAEIYAVP